MLEDLLLEYDGTLLLVSHDRAFLNNIVTSTLILDGSGSVHEYVGGYDDWRKQLDLIADAPPKPKLDSVSRAAPKPATRKLSYKEKRELDELPQMIEALETEQRDLNRKMEDPAFYQQESGVITDAVQRLEELHGDLGRLYDRWAELET